MLWIPLFDRVFYGEPVPTSPENALVNRPIRLTYVFKDATPKSSDIFASFLFVAGRRSQDIKQSLINHLGRTAALATIWWLALL